MYAPRKAKTRHFPTLLERVRRDLHDVLIAAGFPMRVAWALCRGARVSPFNRFDDSVASFGRRGAGGGSGCRSFENARSFIAGAITPFRFMSKAIGTNKGWWRNHRNPPQETGPSAKPGKRGGCPSGSGWLVARVPVAWSTITIGPQSDTPHNPRIFQPMASPAGCTLL